MACCVPLNTMYICMQSTSSFSVTDPSFPTAPESVTGVTVERLNAATMMVSWTPLTLVQARGFVRYRVSYQPQGSRKRQERSVVVDGDQDSVIIDGLMSGVAYATTVEPFNTAPSGVDLPGPSGDDILVPGECL